METNKIERQKKIDEVIAEMKREVISTNKDLTSSVDKMSITILLAHTHPLYRTDYHNRLVRLGVLNTKK